MLESPVALVGVVLQWTSSLLLLLLFYRLGRVGTHRRMLGTWTAAWAGQLIAVTGFTLQAIAALAGRSFGATRSWQWLDGVYVPGMLLFAVLVALNAAEVVGRRVSFAVERAAVLTATAVGILAVLLDKRVLTGTLLVIVTSAVFVGGGVRIVALERRRRGRRLLLPAGMALVGVVALTYQVIRYFGGLLDPFGDFTNTILAASGYASALASAILGAGVVILITEDGFRGYRYAQQERMRELAESQARRIATTKTADEATQVVRRPAESGYEVHPPRIEDVAIVVEQRGRSRVLVDPPAPLRAPTISLRTATLPRPLRRPDGGAAAALVVDHEAAARSTLARIFQRGGWPVREATTGAEALSWLLDVDACDAPAVVLCSFEMPGIGGRELYAHLQEQRPEFLQRLIFVTDGVNELATAEFIRAARCQLVHKPTTVEEVARAVEQVLQ